MIVILILQASKEGDYMKLTELIDKFKKVGKPLTVCDRSGWQAVHYAAKLSDTRCLSALLNADELLLNSVTREHVTPLMVAAGVANLDTVKLLLPLLDNTDVCIENIHGLNSLYYAVLADTPQGNQVCHLLIGRLTGKHFECASSFDTLPYRVVKNKNIEILSALLNAGLDPAFFYGANREKFRDQSYREADGAVPVTLIGYCVKEDWFDGVNLIMETQRKHILEGKNSNGLTHVWQLFTLGSSTGESSALQIICEKGNTECLKLMVAEGFDLALSTLSSVNDLDSSKCSHTMLTPLSVLTYTITGPIWKKQEFIRYVLSQQSCDKFQQCYQKICTTCPELVKEQEESSTNSPILSVLRDREYHPLTMVTKSILQCSPDEHSIGETVQMLLDCQFTFDFDIASHIQDRFRWRNTITTLIREAYYNSKVFDIVKALLNYAPTVPLTMDAMKVACDLVQRFAQQGREELPHFVVIEALSKRSVFKIGRAYEHMFVVKGALAHIRVFDDERMDQEVVPTDEYDWLTTCQLLLKGIRSSMWDNKTMRYDPLRPEIPFSVFFLSVQERQHYFEKQIHTNCDKQLCSKLKDNCSTFSLQSLCRVIIRKQIGFARLIREPVPRCLETPTQVVRDEKWEVSSIDQLPIPKSMHEYLRYSPELQLYDQYVKHYKEQVRFFLQGLMADPESE